MQTLSPRRASAAFLQLIRASGGWLRIRTAVRFTISLTGFSFLPVPLLKGSAASTYTESTSELLAEVAEWQTRRSQKPLRATSCGFDSHLRHHLIDDSGRGSAW